MNNYIYAFEKRHEEKKNTWYLADEVVEGALELIEECYTDEEVARKDAVLDYDNLAINAEIVERENAERDYDRTAEELELDALFATENYIVLSW